MIDEQIIQDVKERLKRTRPLLADITVGDINDGNASFLGKALSGDSAALKRLIQSVTAQRSENNQFNPITL